MAIRKGDCSVDAERVAGFAETVARDVAVAERGRPCLPSSLLRCVKSVQVRIESAIDPTPGRRDLCPDHTAATVSRETVACSEPTRTRPSRRFLMPYGALCDGAGRCRQGSTRTPPRAEPLHLNT